MTIVLVVVFLGILYFLAHLFAQIFSRSGIPDVLGLMLVGLIIGPLLKLVSPANLGQMGTLMVTLTLIVILFQSGLGMGLKTLVKASSRGVLLTLFNFVATTIFVGAAIWWLAGLDPLRSAIVGAMVGGTSSAVVIPMLRQLKMREESSAILLLESALTDVLCIVVALALLDAYKGNGANPAVAVGRVLASFFLASFLGIVGALIWAFLIAKMRSLQDSIFATLAFVLLVFGVTDLAGAAGYIAALAFGITLGNVGSFRPVLRLVNVFWRTLSPQSVNETDKLFFSEIVFVLKTFFFVYVGVSIQISNSWWMMVGLIVTVLAFAVRIPVVRLSVSKETTSRDASVMAVMVPKGLAAAALASIPLQRGVAGGEAIQNVVFAVVLFSIFLTSVMVFLLRNTPVSRLYERLFAKFGVSRNATVDTDDIPLSETPDSKK